MGTRPVVIPDNEVEIPDSEVQVQKDASTTDKPSWWDRTKSILGLNEGVLFGGSGEAGGIAGSPRTAGEAVASMVYPAVNLAGEVAADKVGAAATRLFPSWVSRRGGNVPFAGEAEPGPTPPTYAPEFMERDATALNKEPFAGEGPTAGKAEPMGQGPYSLTKRGPGPYFGPGKGTVASPVRTTPFSKGPSGSFDLPTTVPEKASVPGAAGESWSMQRKVTPQLQTAAAGGDPGAIETMRRLNPTWSPVVIPKSAAMEAGTSPSQLESIREAAGLGGTPTSATPQIASPSPISRSGIANPRGTPTPFTPFQGTPTEIASPLRPEVQQMAESGGKAATTPGWMAGERSIEIDRLKDIIRRGTEEERSQAEAKLHEIMTDPKMFGTKK